MLKSGVMVLDLIRQGNPGLDAEQRSGLAAHFLTGAFGVGDTVAGDHPVHLTRIDHLVGARAVAVVEFSLVEIGDGRQPDMGMGPHVDTATGEELGRPHLIEEDEGADHLAVRRGEGAPDLEPAQIAGPGNNQGFDGFQALIVGALGWVPAHMLAPVVMAQSALRAASTLIGPGPAAAM